MALGYSLKPFVQLCHYAYTYYLLLTLSSVYNCIDCIKGGTDARRRLDSYNIGKTPLLKLNASDTDSLAKTKTPAKMEMSSASFKTSKFTS